MAFDTNRLQQWVRGSCLSEGSGNEIYQMFCNTIVKPCMDVSLASIPKGIELIISRMTCIIRGGAADEEDAIRLKMACSALKMDLSENPLVAGLSLACARMMDKESRSILTLAGRPDKTITEREKALLADCGMQLAMASCNYPLARSLGLAASKLKIGFDELHANSLPTAPLAVRWPETLRQNFQILDQRFVRGQEIPERSLTNMLKIHEFSRNQSCCFFGSIL